MATVPRPRGQRGRPPKQESIFDLINKTLASTQEDHSGQLRDDLKACANDPVRFVRDYITFPPDQELAPYQRDILSALPDRKRVAVHSGHGSGKTAVAALLTIWHALVSDALETDWKVVTTAGTWSQLSQFLWPEIHRWARSLRWDRLGRRRFDSKSELMNLSLRLDFGEAFALTSNRPEFIEGAHARRLLYIFDESKAIPEQIFDSAEGALSAGGAEAAYAIALSTPGTPEGRFYAICTKKRGYGDWWVRHVTLHEAMAAGRIAEQDRAARETQWGRDNPLYRNRILGEFCEDSAEGVLPLSWVEAAQRRWQEWAAAGRPVESHVGTTLGCDIAREGADRTAIAIKRGVVIEEVRPLPRSETMQTTGEIVKILQQREGAIAVVDTVGIGAGVYDRLREQGFAVESFSAAEQAPGTDSTGQVHFLNKRAWAHWFVREQLDPGREGGATIMLPPDEELLADLTAVKWKLTSSGKVQIESKDDLRKRLKRSTDKGDATVMVIAAGDGESLVAFW